MLKIGFSSLSLDKPMTEWAYKLPEYGFDAWEVTGEGGNSLSKEWLTYVAEVKESTGLYITLHAPFSDINLSSLNARIWEESVSQVIEAMELCAEFARVVTVHPGHLSPLSLNYPDEAKERLIAALKRIGKAAEELDYTVGVENMVNFKFVFCRTRVETEEIIEAVASPHVGITLDVGHANTTGELDEFLKSNKIVHAHLHDNDGKHDLHMPIGSGTIDWDKVKEALKNRQIYSILEMRDIEEGIQSLNLLRGLD
ncbi:MAG: sugar phosphate isomerase/epimerase family protein [Methermicoccaceae archaeon]